MKISHLSVIREAEYLALKGVSLNGLILDVGGSNASEYHQLIDGEHSFYAINISTGPKTDMIVDIEKTFPIDTEKYDHAICMNVLEHVFEFENVISEMTRVIKPGGKIILATPMIYKIHGSPDDYLRYTESALRKVAKKYNLKVESVKPLGFGFFSLGAQLLRSVIPHGLLWVVFKRTTIGLDKFFNKVLPGYKTFTKQIPLGYLTVLIK